MWYWHKAILILVGTALSVCQIPVSAQENKLEQVETPTTEEPTVEQKEAKKAEVGPIPTPEYIVNMMLELANVKQTDVLYDLGCGDGRIVVTAAKKFGCKATGFDIDPECIRASRDNAKAAGVEHLVTITQQDIFELDLSEVDVVTLYLLPKLNQQLIPQLEKMKPGSRIVSHEFDILGVEPDFEVKCLSRIHGETNSIYVWELPLHMVEIPEDPPATAPLAERLLRGLVIGAIVLAVLFWLLQRLGLMRINVTIERPVKRTTTAHDEVPGL